MYIEQKYSNKGLIFNRDMKAVNWMPTVDAVVTNIETGNSIPYTEEFLIDSGASISILGPSLKYLFNNTKPVNKHRVIYGSGYKDLEVFKIKLEIKGYGFELLAAIDDGFKFAFHILGLTKGLSHFNHIVLNNDQKCTKLVRKYEK